MGREIDTSIFKSQVFKKGHKEANEADPDPEHEDLDIDIEDDDEDDIHSIYIKQ